MSNANDPLLAPLDGYNSNRDLHEDAELTHVGRGTPGGEYLRRFWQPVAYTNDVDDLPLKLRILGEDLILFKTASGGGILWEMTMARAGGVAALLIFLVTMPPKAPWRGFWLTGITAGMLDTLGSLLYIRATQLGRLDVVAVVGSLYPAGTILLAALVLREWPTRRQMAGMALALAAVALLSM